jgi:hypothetical protein
VIRASRVEGVAVLSVFFSIAPASAARRAPFNGGSLRPPGLCAVYFAAPAPSRLSSASFIGSPPP